MYFPSNARHFALLLIFTISITHMETARAQGQITMSDALMKGRSQWAPANLRQLQWIPETDVFTYVYSDKIVRVQASDLKTDTLDLLPAMNAALASANAPTLRGLPGMKWEKPGLLSFMHDNSMYYFSTTEGLMKRGEVPKNADITEIHEKTGHVGYVSEGNLMVFSDGQTLPIAKPEKEGIVYGKSVHREEFGISKGMFWNNAGSKLAFYRMDESMVTQYPIYVLDSMPAVAREIRYPFAGSASHHVTIGVFDLARNTTVYLKTGEPAEQYLTNISWTADDRYILVAVVNRAQDHIWFKQFDAVSGELVKVLFEETNEKWAEPENEAINIPGNTDQFIWQSERDGFNHLYLYDLKKGLVRQLSKGAFPVVAFYGFSAKGDRCYYQCADASGLNRHIWMSNLATGAMTKLTEDDGVHNGLVNTSGDWVLDGFSNLSTPRIVYAIPTKKPADRAMVFAAKNPLEQIKTGLTKFVELPSPGGFTLQGRVILPPNFDATKQYPAIVYVYNGPHVQMVVNSWLGNADMWMHRLAQEGFVVFSMDGRGSANRGFAFESAIHRHCGDAEIEDQMTGVSYLKAQSYIDPARIGVYGWSYGGFMATSLMTRPEAKGAFKCGVAGGPVIDWSMYEIMYTERYMDTPAENPEGYKKASLFNYVDNLDGRLLMIHGTSDDVVLWQHSLRYIRECVRKGKQIDYFVYPEHLHNVMGKDRVHLFEKIERFFKDNL